MQSFVTQPGAPLLSFNDVSASRSPVTQSRFFLSAAANTGNPQRWALPVCIKTTGKPICRVLTPEDSALPIPMDIGLPVFYANANGKGYYRTAYTPQQYAAIVAKAETALAPPERIGLVGDRWALVRSGQGTVGDFLNLVLALKQDPNAAVLETALRKASTISWNIAEGEDHDRLQAVLRSQFTPVYEALGKPSPKDSLDRERLRALLFHLLGGAKDPAVLTQARQIADAVYSSGGQRDKNLDPSFSDEAIAIAATNGDAALYDKILNASKTLTSPELQTQALFTLPRFEVPALVQRTLDYAVSGEVRNQDSWILLSSLLGNPDTRIQSWDYIRQNWDKVHAQFTTSSGVRVVAATGSFCTVKQREEVIGFFATHKVDASERTLTKAIDSINDCTQLKATQQPNLHQWLESQTK
jgi:aminopeptidase N/puromycin-sensitive aminopeptidase